MADINKFFNIKKAMDKLWFNHNILLSQPTEINISMQSKSYKTSTDDKKIRKKEERLNISMNSPLYQLQLPTRVRERRVTKMRKRYWSLSELENFEIEGFKDLGFVFSEEKLSPEIIKMLPGLRRIERKEAEHMFEDREVRRPYLSEVWLVDRSNYLLLNLPRCHDIEDMKKHLRLWAQSVASSIHHES